METQGKAVETQGKAVGLFTDPCCRHHCSLVASPAGVCHSWLNPWSPNSQADEEKTAMIGGGDNPTLGMPVRTLREGPLGTLQGRSVPLQRGAPQRANTRVRRAGTSGRVGG